jgi:FkbM family methyltransferase
VYLEQHYGFESPSPPPEVIFDAGSHIGLAALEFRARWPNSTVYAFEPDPTAFRTLIENARHDSRIVPINLAVAGANGTREFFTSAQTWISGFARRNSKQIGIQVPVRTLDSLMDELGIDHVDLLKLDIEGAEREVLLGSHRLGRIRTVIGELHGDVVGFQPDDFFARCLPGREVQVVRSGTTCTFMATRPDAHP